MADVQERLGELSVPTMLLHGGDDAIVPASATEPIGELAIATRRVLPGLRHEVLNEPSWQESMRSYINFANGALGL